MKKRLSFILILASLLLLCQGVGVAFAAPYDTYTQGPEYASVPTQTAYEPKNTISPLDSFKNPEDMCYDDGYLYVADAGNKRVVKMTLQGAVDYSIVDYNDTLLGLPSGVTVSGNYLYVADKTNRIIYIYDKNTGAEITAIGKPDNPLVGENTAFIPTKIAADSRGNIYVACEGSVNGIMQLNLDGEFIGNVGANLSQASLTSILQEIFYSDEQKTTFLNTPRSPTNLAIASNGLLYTVTNGAYQDAIKKLNSQGEAIMSPTLNKSTTVAITLDEDGNVYGVDSDGYVTVYDSEGNMLFTFGGKSEQERLGLLSNPVAICEVDGDLLVLDKTYGFVITYQRTEFADLVFTAVSYYKDGLYLDGEQYWQEVLRYNSTFILSYRALARANMKKGNYELALEQFKLAEDKDGYSDAYWEIRNVWLRNNLGWVLGVIVGIVVIVFVLKFLNKRNQKIFAPFRTLSGKINAVVLLNQLKHIKRFVTAPADAVYEVKYHQAASPLSATILYVWFIVLQILSVVITGFLFTNDTVYNTQAGEVILYSVLPLLLGVVCNYFVSTVTDGEGKIAQCYTVTIYALAPYLILALPIFIISNFLTYNETVVLQALQILMYAWMAINLFRSIAELHDYSFGGTIKNILLTAFCFAMVLLFIIVIRMLATQLFGYFFELFTEMFTNVA